ncbi:MAG: hypothetical protein IKL79_04105 [Clostridia bacterium]|nr:hypothetical protein [Clostridia bacterium]MBR3681168.1 hypothetical protein [Clostridia bacterium]
MKKTKEEFNIRDIVSIFLPKLWIIVSVALVLALLLGFYSAFLKTDTYSSTATMLVSNDATSLNNSVLDVSTEMVKRCEIIIFSDEFLQKIITDVKADENYSSEWRLSVSFVKGVLSMKQRGDTEFFDITVTTEDSVLSYTIVNAVAKRIESDLPELLPYDSKYIRTGTVNHAVPALNPDSKHTVRNSVIGFAAGAILSMVAVFVCTMFDVTIRDKKKIEDNFDIPVLGVIPKFEVEEGNDK